MMQMNSFGNSVIAIWLVVGSLVAVAMHSRTAVTPKLQSNHEQISEAPSSDAVESDSDIVAGEILGTSELSYRGFTIQTRFRKVKIDNSTNQNAKSKLLDVSYSILKQKGRVLAEFDANVYSALGNSTSFGLFSFLGGDQKQLLVSQDVPRGGNQWIVSLSPTVRVIYNGRDFRTGREGPDMSIVDLDEDGVYEIIQPITDFYKFHDLMSVSKIPLPSVIFKYDKRARRYLPANRLFQDYLLKDIDEAKRNAALEDTQFDHQSEVFRVVMDYIFAGKEPEAWAYYEEAYKLTGKAKIKERIKDVLRQQPVYRLMYTKIARARVK